jgi:hypothetical protein
VYIACVGSLCLPAAIVVDSTICLQEQSRLFNELFTGVSCRRPVAGVALEHASTIRRISSKQREETDLMIPPQFLSPQNFCEPLEFLDSLINREVKLKWP